MAHNNDNFNVYQKTRLGLSQQPYYGTRHINILMYREGIYS